MNVTAAAGPSLMLALLMTLLPAAPASAQDGSKNPDKAIKQYSDAVKKAPEDFESWFNLAYAYYRAEKHDEAAQAIGKATSLNGSSTMARRLEGAIAVQRGKSSEAIAAYEKARELETASGGEPSLDTVSGLAESYYGAGRWDDAITAYKQAWKVAKAEGGDLSVIHNQLGTAYLKKGESDEAIKWFEANVEKAPELAASHYNLGMTYRKLAADDYSMWGRAATAFRKAADLLPSDALAQFFAGEALLLSGSNKESIPYLDRYLAADPDGKKAMAKFGAEKGKSDVFEAASLYKVEALK